MQRLSNALSLRLQGNARLPFPLETAEPKVGPITHWVRCKIAAWRDGGAR